MVFRWTETWRTPEDPEPVHTANPSGPTVVEGSDVPEIRGWAILMRSFPAGLVLFILIVDIWIFVSTEKTISNNSVGPGEGQWTFGQTLALLVVIFPAMDVWRQTREVLDKRHARMQDGNSVPQACELREVCCQCLYLHPIAELFQIEPNSEQAV